VAEQHPFLSPEWMDAVRRIREEMPAPDVPAVGLMKMNLLVSATPFDSDVKAHVDTSDGELIIEQGHLDAADLTVSVDYDTARSVFVGLDFTVAMQAFMAGKVKVQGDITKLMMLGTQGVQPDAKAVAIGQAIRDVTAP
jgi:putative sterol carrier protein